MSHRIALLFLFSVSLAQATSIIGDVRIALNNNDIHTAEAQLQRYRSTQGITPEYLEAYSWLGRAALAAKQYDKALDLAAQTRDMVTPLLNTRPLDAEPHLPLALGASIETTAQTMAEQGQRDQAVTLLQKQLALYRNTSLRTRLQKNLNLLSLEGKPAPAIETRVHLGPPAPSLLQLRGKPVILLFWAHWCQDCKAEVPLLARLTQQFGSKGLVLIGPTQHYGYVANGRETTPSDELKYIDQVRQQYYAPLGAMPVPISEDTFKNYGASTTPTLVFIDRRGIVRRYHPGTMTYDELVSAVTQII